MSNFAYLPGAGRTIIIMYDVVELFIRPTYYYKLDRDDPPLREKGRQVWYVRVDGSDPCRPLATHVGYWAGMLLGKTIVHT
jgi:hypothetical protein